jgi:NitT/TauT family transport system substrate-binding protein
MLHHGQAKRAWLGLVAGLASVTALAACSSSSPSTAGTSAAGGSGSCSTVTNIKIGTTGSISDAGLMMANQLGYFKKYCISVSFQRINDSASQVTALATNQVQVLGFSNTAALFTSATQGIKMKVVGDKGGLSGTLGSYGVMVAKKYAGSSDSQTLHNAVGKNFALASTTDEETLLMNDYLKQYGLSLNDYHVVLIPFTSQAAALENGSIQVAYSAEPWMSETVQSGAAVLLTHPGVGAAFGTDGPSLASLCYGPFMLNPQNKTIAQNFMDAYVLGVRYYDNAMFKNQNTAQVESIVASNPFIGVPVAKYAAMHKAWLDPNQLAGGQSPTNEQSFLQNLENYYVSTGVMKKSQAVPASEVLDLSFAKAAIAKFGADQLSGS